MPQAITGFLSANPIPSAIALKLRDKHNKKHVMAPRANTAGICNWMKGIIGRRNEENLITRIARIASLSDLRVIFTLSYKDKQQ